MKIYKFIGYKLSLQSTCIRDEYDHTKVKYTFKSPNNEILFEGNDFGCPSQIKPESKESAIQLLGFLTLKPGDTDSDYFDNYTEAQLNFCNSSDCEELSSLVYDYEEEGINSQ